MCIQLWFQVFLFTHNLQTDLFSHRWDPITGQSNPRSIGKEGVFNIPELEPHYQMQFSVIHRKLVLFLLMVEVPFCWEHSQRILSV